MNNNRPPLAPGMWCVCLDKDISKTRGDIVKLARRPPRSTTLTRLGRLWGTEEGDLFYEVELYPIPESLKDNQSHIALILSSNPSPHVRSDKDDDA